MLQPVTGHRAWLNKMDNYITLSLSLTEYRFVFVDYISFKSTLLQTPTQFIFVDHVQNLGITLQSTFGNHEAIAVPIIVV